ncbi:hypothetical protein AAMO2058_000882500 [Amorphochlora amoebiformis]
MSESAWGPAGILRLVVHGLGLGFALLELPTKGVLMKKRLQNLIAAIYVVLLLFAVTSRQPVYAGWESYLILGTLAMNMCYVAGVYILYLATMANYAAVRMTSRLPKWMNIAFISSLSVAILISFSSVVGTLVTKRIEVNAIKHLSGSFVSLSGMILFILLFGHLRRILIKIAYGPGSDSGSSISHIGRDKLPSRGSKSHVKKSSLRLLSYIAESVKGSNTARSCESISSPSSCKRELKTRPSNRGLKECSVAFQIPEASTENLNCVNQNRGGTKTSKPESGDKDGIKRSHSTPNNFTCAANSASGPDPLASPCSKGYSPNPNIDTKKSLNNSHGNLGNSARLGMASPSITRGNSSKKMSQSLATIQTSQSRCGHTNSRLKAKRSAQRITMLFIALPAILMISCMVATFNCVVQYSSGGDYAEDTDREAAELDNTNQEINFWTLQLFVFFLQYYGYIRPRWFENWLAEMSRMRIM